MIQIFQNDPDDLHQRQYERAKSQGACMVSAREEGTEANRKASDTLFSVTQPGVSTFSPQHSLIWKFGEKNPFSFKNLHSFV